MFVSNVNTNYEFVDYTGPVSDSSSMGDVMPTSQGELPSQVTDISFKKNNGWFDEMIDMHVNTNTQVQNNGKDGTELKDQTGRDEHKENSEAAGNQIEERYPTELKPVGSTEVRTESPQPQKALPLFLRK
jgi:hypothetical protein